MEPALDVEAELLFTLRPHGGAMGIPRAEDERLEPVLALCQHGASGGFEEGLGRPADPRAVRGRAGAAPPRTGDWQPWRSRRRLG